MTYKIRKNRNGIQKEIEQKKIEKVNEFFLIVQGNKAELKQWKSRKAMGKS